MSKLACRSTVILALLFAACDDDGPMRPDARPDARDGAIPDTRLPDARDTQGPGMDTAPDMGDAAPPQPDAPADRSDAAAPDTAPADTALPDTALPDTAPPDTAPPPDLAPDMTEPDATVPTDTGSDASDAAPVSATRHFNCGACAAGEVQSVSGVCLVPEPTNNACGTTLFPRPGTCSLAHAVARCDGPACAISACHTGYGNCDGDPDNGCEELLTTPQRCGNCNNACNPGEVCTGAGCVAMCIPPETTCAGNTCQNLTTSPLACGGCSGHACTQGGSVGLPTCSGGTCDFQCPSGYLKCQGVCHFDAEQDGACASSCGDCTRGFGDAVECTPGGCQRFCASTATFCPTGAPIGGHGCAETDTDEANCGGCGQACNGVCIAGVCQAANGDRVAALAASPRGFAQDATHLYWAAGNNIERVAKAGGTVETVAMNQAQPLQVEVVAGVAYWSSNLGGGIYQAPVTGGSGMLVTAASQPEALATDGTHLYWDDSGTGAIRRVAIAGGASESVGTYPNPPRDIEVDATHVYTADEFGAGSADNRVRRVPKAGGAFEPLETTRPGLLALDADHAYTSFTGLSGFSWSITQIDKATGDLRGVATHQDTNGMLDDGFLPSGIRPDANHIYFTSAGRIFRAERCGFMKTMFNAPTPGDPGQPSKAVLGLLIDDTHVYWFEDNAVRKLPK